MAYQIFIVDDDRFLLDLYAVKFKNAGHEVRVFGGGEELLTELRKGAKGPDAILIDVIMPGVSGLEAIELIRKEKLVPETKIIVLSNQGQDSDIDKARVLGVAGYIVKASAIPSEVLTETLHIIENPNAKLT